MHNDDQLLQVPEAGFYVHDQVGVNFLLKLEPMAPTLQNYTRIISIKLCRKRNSFQETEATRHNLHCIKTIFY